MKTETLTIPEIKNLIRSVEYQKRTLLERRGYYSKSVAKLGDRIVKLTERLNKKENEKNITA